jgi:phosphoribosyl 1,2-cyclic phosphate phosphodiesterase
MTLKVTVLGTGTSQGVPVVACDCRVCQSTDARDQRLRTAVLLETPKSTIVIDAGPDFRQQMLREKVKKLDALLITHNHKDHTGGLDDVRAFNWVLKKPMEVFARDSVIKSIQKDFDYAFEEEKYPGVPQINLNTITNNPFEINGERIIPIDAMHARLPVFGFRIGDFSYLTDASIIQPEELDKMKGSRYIIINALRKEKHYSHFNLEEAIEILQYLNPQKGYITHISHQMGLHEEISKELPTGIELAYDGLMIEI